jgi:hypothetical protein
VKTVKIEITNQDNREKLFELLRLEGFSVWKRIKYGIISVCFEVPDDAVTGGGK